MLLFTTTMTNIFDLAQSAAELPSLNSGVAGLIYDQVTPLRSVLGDNFPNGPINLPFEASGTKWWIPNKSRIRMRANITKGDGNVLELDDDISVNMGLMGALFQNLEFRMHGKVISRVSEFVAQVDALDKRLSHSRTWLNGVGADLERWAANFQERQNDICVNGIIEEKKYAPIDGVAIPIIPVANTYSHGFVAGTIAFIAAGVMDLTGNVINTGLGLLTPGDVMVVQTVAGNFANGDRYLVKRVLNATTVVVEREQGTTADVATNAANLIDQWTIVRARDRIYNSSSNRGGIDVQWIPPLSIFKVSHAIPASDFELRLNPSPTQSYQLKAIQSLLGNKIASTALNDNDFKFEVVDLYLEACMVDGPAVQNFSYFMSLDNTRCQMENITGGTSFQTKTLQVPKSTVALTVAFQYQDTDDTRNSESIFKFPSTGAGAQQADSGELLLTRFQISYGGEQKPSPDADVIYRRPDGFINSRYAESALYSGSYNDPAPGETRQEWIKRGMYMYFPYPKDGTSEAENVTVKYQFSIGPAVGVANVLLFDHSKSMVLVNVVNGKTITVKEQDG